MDVDRDARRGRARRLLSIALPWALAGLVVVSPAASGVAPDPYATTVAYVGEFYPLWFVYNQTAAASRNQLIAPDRISPLYQTVVAINNDTLYASAPVDLSAGPVIVTIPESPAGYSVLTLDPYGNIYDGIPSKPSGLAQPTQVYALTPPGYAGPLP